MDLLDIFILLAIAGLAVRGWRAGFFREGGSLVGFLIGLFAGAALVPLTTIQTEPPTIRLVAQSSSLEESDRLSLMTILIQLSNSS